MRARFQWFLGSALLLAGSRLLPAQASTLYLTGEGYRYTLQGGVLASNGPAVRNGCELPIAVSGDVRTLGCNALSQGAQYTLGGSYTGTNYDPFPLGALGCTGDGTTDGTNNYLTGACGGGVFSTDRSWGGLTGLFSTGAVLGITYDPRNNSLWVSPFNGSGQITDYAMDGTPLFSLSTGISGLASLAYDPADQSLWFFDRNTVGTSETFYQYSTSGDRLSSQNHADVNLDFFGGEFEEGSSAPEPDSVFLLATGLAGLGAALRRRRAVRP